MMLRIFSLIIIVFCVLFSKAILAQENIYLVVKGGISLGSYESGLNWALLRHILKSEDTRLLSISGASAGSINSILSAIEYCQQAAVKKPINNIFFSSWDIDVSKLLDTGKVSNALFSRNELDEKVKDLERRLHLGASKSCNLIITMSLTRFRAHKRALLSTGHDITLQRFVVPLRVVADGPGKPIRFENIYEHSELELDAIPSVYIHLPEDRDSHEIPFSRVRDVAYASSAFPVAFAPKEVQYCLSTQANDAKPCFDDEKTKIQSAKFSDGGLFDNSPIGVAIDITKQRMVFTQNRIPKSNSEASSRDTILYINPDNYRPEDKPAACNNQKAGDQAEKKLGDAGIVEYGEYFYQSFANATSFELQKALIEIENNKNHNPRLLTSSRFHHLLADFHAHFGAFYSRDFRQHDYFVGVYDGLATVASLQCGGRHSSKSCLGEKIAQSINEIFDSALSDTSQKNSAPYKDFMLYLYHEEFGGEMPNIKGNGLIALNLAFKNTVNSSSKDSCKDVSLAEYLENLEALKQQDNFKTVQFSADSNFMTSDYNSWQASKIGFAIDNIKSMQACSDCDATNESIGDVIKASQSLIEAVLEHMDKDVWPLSWDPVKKWKSSLGIYLGYDAKEIANDLGIKLRYPYSSCRCSLDSMVDWHMLSSRSEYDHYWSASIAGVYHSKSGNALIFPTVGFGIEYSRPSTLYRASDHALFITAGIFSEILNLKYAVRYNDVDANQNGMIRAQKQLIVSLELIKLYRIASKR